MRNTRNDTYSINVTRTLKTRKIAMELNFRFRAMVRVGEIRGVILFVFIVSRYHNSGMQWRR